MVRTLLRFGWLACGVALLVILMSHALPQSFAASGRDWQGRLTKGYFTWQTWDPEFVPTARKESSTLKVGFERADSSGLYLMSSSSENGTHFTWISLWFPLGAAAAALSVLHLWLLVRRGKAEPTTSTQAVNS